MLDTAEHETIAGSPRLHLRRRRSGGAPVLYVHGATFPCVLAIGYRFGDGRSWEDSLAQRGFEVWGLDFAGYGGSERPLGDALFGRAADAAYQIVRAVEHIRGVHNGMRISIIAHSWGTIPTAMFAASEAEALARLVLFAPILLRRGRVAHPAEGLWRCITVADQRERFEQDTPRGMSSVLAEPDLQRWGEAWLATDPEAALRSPPAVRVPSGPQRDVAAMWSGEAFYDPAAIVAPTLVVRGAWDSLCTDADVARFVAASQNRARQDVRLPEGGHLMHLEIGRHRLWRAVNEFLTEDAQ